jgi:hypothetical protein
MKSKTTLDSKQSTEHDSKLPATLYDIHSGATITPAPERPLLSGYARALNLKEKFSVSENILYQFRPHTQEYAYSAPPGYEAGTLTCYKQETAGTEFKHFMTLYNFHDMIDYQDFKIITYNNKCSIAIEIRSAKSLQLLDIIIPKNRIRTSQFSRCEVEKNTYSIVIHELNGYKHQLDTNFLYAWHSIRKWTSDVKHSLINNFNIASDHSRIITNYCLPQETILPEGLNQPSAPGYTNPLTIPIDQIFAEECGQNNRSRFSLFAAAVGVGAAAAAAIAVGLYSKLKSKV